jgi:hypothetical protein
MRFGVVTGWLGLCGTAAADPARPPRVEVAFALDATGSMGPYINEARAKIRAIAAELSTGTPKPEVKFGLVAFRDRGDTFVTRVTPFTPDVEVMHRALDATEAGGGGDFPESVFEGVKDAVTRLKWTPPEDPSVIRLVYVVGDAPPQHYPDGPTEKSIAAEARKRHISIHGIVCGEGDPDFEALARHTEGRVFSLTGPGRMNAAGAAHDTLVSALTDTTKAYSSAIGVSFKGPDVPAIATEALTVPDVPVTGLIGRHVLWVRDDVTFRDVWAAHTSLMPLAARPPVPSVDFAKQHLLVLGGSDGGLELSQAFAEKGRRAVRVQPAAAKSVRFVLVPASLDKGGK